MKKMKCISSITLVILLLIPFIRISNAQGSYVGIQNGGEYEWALSIYRENWNTYVNDDLGATLENLVPLGASNLTRVFNDWKNFAPPQSYWPLKVTSIGVEESGLLFSPSDNSTITYTPVNGTFGWILSLFDSDEWDETWYVVNDTSSFLKQTVNLSYSFSFYTMFSVFIAPTTMSWSTLVSEFLAEMTAKGGLYTNIVATAQSNGYSIDIPALGFENNSAAININVKYNSKGVLSSYKFSYGGKTLLDFVPGKFIPEHERVPDEYYFIFIGLAVILLAEIVFYIYMRKGRK
ncbi:MAG: hypothetical protein EAX91_08260 [Candidatus Lokiarchaeota archaeon]|nr:hypothetical protein [Candidatus Lokiarchaeota archaeon]